MSQSKWPPTASLVEHEGSRSQAYQSSWVVIKILVTNRRLGADCGQFLTDSGTLRTQLVSECQISGTGRRYRFDGELSN